MAHNIGDLVASARAGDKEAFGTLYQEYFAPIYRFVFFKTRHKETAEDITQTVFAKALTSIPAFTDTGAPFIAWLYTIARNQCLDFWKKKQDIVLDDVKNGEDVWETLPGKLSADKESLTREREGILMRALDALSDEQRELVILRFIEERSYQEIEKILGKSEEALRAMNYRAMKILRKELKDKGIDVEL